MIIEDISHLNLALILVSFGAALCFSLVLPILFIGRKKQGMWEVSSYLTSLGLTLIVMVGVVIPLYEKKSIAVYNEASAKIEEQYDIKFTQVEDYVLRGGETVKFQQGGDTDVTYTGKFRTIDQDHSEMFVALESGEEIAFDNYDFDKAVELAEEYIVK